MPVGRPSVIRSRTRRPAGHGSDEYELLEELGRGGMGVVYKARQAELNRVVALKMILGRRARRRRASRPGSAREAEAVARLQHPNIVQVYEVGEHDGPPFFSLEFVAGGTLADRAGRRPLPPPERPPRWSRRWPGPSTTPTGTGIVHRDLKPANVLLSGERRATSDETARPDSAHPSRRSTRWLADSEDHRLRPGQAGSTATRGHDPDRRGPGHAELHGPGAGGRGRQARSARRPTCTRWGPSCTSA